MTHLIESEKAPQKELRLIRRSLYGREVLYPNCPESRFFAQIAGTKTLAPQNLLILREAGYSFRIQIESIHGCEVEPIEVLIEPGNEGSEL